MKKNATEEKTGNVPVTAQEAEKKPGRGRKRKTPVEENVVPEQMAEPSPKKMPEAVPEQAQEPESGEASEDIPENPEASGEAEPDGILEEKTEEAGEPDPGDALKEVPEQAEEPGQAEPGGMPENISETLPAPAVPVQVIESPLKRMKQEFSERAQIIREQMRNIQNAFITIGFQLHWIRENNMFRVLNYKNVYEYAEKEYGLKKTTCCNFISIIENYAERDENGEVIESIADCYRNYSASQLVAMLGMDEDTRQQVTPDMSVRAINRLRKGEPETPAPVVESTPDETVPEAAVSAVVETEMTEPETMPVESREPEDMQEPETVDAETPVALPDNADREASYLKEAEKEGKDAAAALPEDNVPDEDGTLVEIESYSDYQRMAEELDFIMKHVFSAQNSVRVKIVCVQG